MNFWKRLFPPVEPFTEQDQKLLDWKKRELSEWQPIASASPNDALAHQVVEQLKADIKALERRRK